MFFSFHCRFIAVAAVLALLRFNAEMQDGKRSPLIRMGKRENGLMCSVFILIVYFRRWELSSSFFLSVSLMFPSFYDDPVSLTSNAADMNQPFEFNVCFITNYDRAEKNEKKNKTLTGR